MRTSLRGYRRGVKRKCGARGAIAACLALAVWCGLPAIARAQTNEAADDGETVRVDAGLVDLNVSVFAREGRRVPGELRREDFAVYEDNARQDIAFFASAEAPFDLLLLLDLSGSTVDKLDLVRKSALRFAEATRPQDRVAVMTFTDETRVVSNLTSDRADLAARIKKIGKPRGGTNFYDALREALDHGPGAQSNVRQRRRAVIVMTDGVDNALPGLPGVGSMTEFDELVEIVRRSGAIVLPIYLDTEEEMVRERRATAEAYVTARAQLAALADESGGLLYRARRLEDLKGVYEQVIRDLGRVYSIGYVPTNKRRDNTFRAVEVRLAARPELAARTKRGYLAK